MLATPPWAGARVSAEHSAEGAAARSVTQSSGKSVPTHTASKKEGAQKRAVKLTMSFRALPTRTRLSAARFAPLSGGLKLRKPRCSVVKGTATTTYSARTTRPSALTTSTTAAAASSSSSSWPSSSPPRASAPPSPPLAAAAGRRRRTERASQPSRVRRPRARWATRLESGCCGTRYSSPYTQRAASARASRSPSCRNEHPKSLA
mmetsp:Transcript_8145/g.30044  ORF Transcript_8145/g.30044 Transcript_8145/m.30044 type:complete len:205 (-) Transcript_8145:511-1125(-)